MKCGLNEKWLVCRICLQQPKEPMQTIFDRNIEKDLTRMILECGGVPIKQFDHYPDKICNKCYKCLQVAHKFRATCQRSHKHLSRFIAPVVVDKADNVFFEEDHDSFPEPSGMPEDPVSLEEPTEAVVKVENQQTDDDIIKEEFMLHVDDDEDEFVEIYEPMTEDEQKQVFEISDEHFTDDDEEEVEYLELEEDLELPSSDDDYVPNEVNSKQSRIRVAAKRSLTQQATTSQNVVKRVKREPKGKKSKGSSYICDFCGNKYPSQGRLTEHIKLHKGIKPHECEICGHAFAQTQQLARHMNTHTGNRPYKCSYCPAAFADLSTRNKHHRIHTNERPYVCDVCGKAFTYTNTLKFHKMIHTGEKPFVCEICGKGFQQAYKLRSHKMVHEKKGIKLEKAEASEINSEQKYTPVQVEAVTQVLHM